MHLQELYQWQASFRASKRQQRAVSRNKGSRDSYKRSEKHKTNHETCISFWAVFICLLLFQWGNWETGKNKLSKTCVFCLSRSGDSQFCYRLENASKMISSLIRSPWLLNSSTNTNFRLLGMSAMKDGKVSPSGTSDIYNPDWEKHILASQELWNDGFTLQYLERNEPSTTQ